MKINTKEYQKLKEVYEYYKNNNEQAYFNDTNKNAYYLSLNNGLQRYKDYEAALFLEVLRESSILKNNKLKKKLNFNNLDVNNFDEIEWNNHENIPSFEITTINDENEKIKIGIVIKELTDINVNFANINEVSDRINYIMAKNWKVHSQNYDSLYLIIRNGIDPNSIPSDHHGNYAIELLDNCAYQSPNSPFTTAFEIPKTFIEEFKEEEKAAWWD